MQKKLFDLFSYIIIEKSYIIVYGISIIGLLSSFCYELTMDKDAWFWFFSSLAQTFAALIALAAAFSIFNLESYNVQIHSKFVSTSKVRVKCIFELSKSSTKARFLFQNNVSYP